MNTFGERLRQYRRARGLTQQELADLLGVSNKSISRWESDGGYPDVPLLLPLARALGVSVDDLLDGEKPVRKLTRTDFQSLLSFAFALGGGVLFFLLDLFMPTVLCYLAYLGCVAYGVYLQRYYTRHSRWFHLSNAAMLFAVNLTFVVKVGSTLLALSFFGSSQAMLETSIQGRLLSGQLGSVLFLVLAAVCVAALLTAGMEGAILSWSRGKGLKPNAVFRLTLRRPPLRRALPALGPVLAGAFWLPFLLESCPVAWYEHQETAFAWWLVALGVVGAVVLWRGQKRYILPYWLVTACCWGMTALLTYREALSTLRENRIPYLDTMNPNAYVPLGEPSWATALCALVLAAVWLLLSALTLRKQREPEQTEE